jgi:zinc transporter ZupT
MGTLLGGAIFLALIPAKNDQTTSSPISNTLYAHLQAASAGCMILLSLDLFLLESIPAIGSTTASIYFLIGIGMFGMVQKIIPEPDMSKLAADEKVMRSTVVTFVAMAIHNVPEGIAVASTTMHDVKLGINLCIAILLHNILGISQFFNYVFRRNGGCIADFCRDSFTNASIVLDGCKW